MECQGPGDNLRMRGMNLNLRILRMFEGIFSLYVAHLDEDCFSMELSVNAWLL